MKKTPWFPADVKPARPGVYEVKACRGSTWYRRWNGLIWFIGDYSVSYAAKEQAPTFIRSPWRGLTKETQ